MTHPLDEWPAGARPDYARIADLEHQEAAERPDASYLPHGDDEVRRACEVCGPPVAGTVARVIELRPGAATPAPVEEPGPPEVQEGTGGPGVPAPVVEGVVVPRADDDPPLPWRAQAERRPVVAKWVRDAQERRLAAAWAARYAGHIVAFHAVRAPLYGLRTAAYAPRGAGRTVRVAWRWLWDAEGKPLRSAAVASTSTAEYMALDRIRKERVKTRLFVTVLGTTGTVIGWLVGSMFVPNLGLYMLVVAVLAAGLAGRNRDKPLIDDPIISNPAAMRLTSGQIVDALGALGIAQVGKALGKSGRGIEFASPVARDGPGWRADVDLPLGVTATDIIEKRDNLASGLRRPLGCVWPEAAPDRHAGRMVLWVGDQDMSKARQPPWPLAKKGEADLFVGVPFGTDQRGRTVALTLMFTSVIIGAIPRMGKTFLLRLLLLIAALDVRAEIHAYDLKGTGDLSPLEPVAHRYRAGDEAEDVEYALADLRELRDELRRRAKVIRGLPKDICPENKVTPELAARRSLRLHPIVIGTDECQVWFEHPEHGAEFEAICTDLVKRGPALGIVMMLATQRPDAKSLPTGISANASTRLCLKVMGHQENDMVLGTGRHKAGIRATMFSFNDKGICWFVGDGEEPRIVRAVYLDAPAAEAIALRARALRATASTLSGHALGDVEVEAIEAAADLLADVAAVIQPGEVKVWSSVVIERLRELRPGGPYDALNPTALANQLSDGYGVRTSQAWGRTADGDERNRKGLVREEVMAAIEARQAGA